MGHVWMSPVTHVNESRHIIHITSQRISRTCEWVPSHMWSSHVTSYILESNRFGADAEDSGEVPNMCAMAHSQHVNESCHNIHITCQCMWLSHAHNTHCRLTDLAQMPTIQRRWVMAYIWFRGNESWHTYIRLSERESWHIYTWVMSHTFGDSEEVCGGYD